MVPSGIDSQVWHQHAWRNRLQSFFLLALMGGFLALLGWLLWGDLGLAMLLMLGLLAVLFTPILSPLMVMRLYGARPILPQQAPVLAQLMRELSERAGLDYVPQLYYVPSQVLNAFATGGREHAAIAITDGLLRTLDLRELAGVLAHELSHVRNKDLRVLGLADLLSRATSLLALLGQFLLLINLPLMLLGMVTLNWYAIALLLTAPLFSALAQLALARTREYDADLNAARLTGDPDGLASALYKLEQIQGGWMEQLFMPSRRAPQPSPLRSHPLTEERIRRLQALKPELSRRPLSEPITLEDWLPGFAPRVTRAPRRHRSGLWH